MAGERNNFYMIAIVTNEEKFFQMRLNNNKWIVAVRLWQLLYNRLLLTCFSSHAQALLFKTALEQKNASN